MNNLHRELAPISDAAWAQIEEETSRTFKRYLAGRRVVDVQGPGGVALSAVGTGHLRNIEASGDGILARQREVKALVEVRVPFDLDRQQIDDVERGAPGRLSSPAGVLFAEELECIVERLGERVEGQRVEPSELLPFELETSVPGRDGPDPCHVPVVELHELDRLARPAR